MRIALKIAAWMLLVLLVMQAVMGMAHLSREARIVTDELRRDHRIFGAALAATLESDPAVHRTVDEARAFVEAVEIAEREIGLTIALDPPAAQQQIIEGGILITVLPVSLADRSAFLILQEPLVEVDRVSREGRQRLLLSGALSLALGLLAAAVVGQVVVGTRMVKLVERARQIGGGDLTPQPVAAGGDEVSDIARALEDLAEQLGQARLRTEQEQAARLAAVEQFRHADRMRLVGDLAAGVAHELGSPLHVVCANADLLVTDRSLSEDSRELADDIVEQATRMDHLVRQLLELSHPDPPPCVLEPLPALWAQLRLTAGGLVRGTPVQLVIEEPPDILVRFHAAHFVQAMANLIRNAVQIQPDGGRVRISAITHEAHVEITVEDDGPGIDAPRRERIFAPFYTTKAPGEGVGLGLSLVRGLIEESGGTITVSTSSTGGACFHLVLPTTLPPEAA